jgi:hypothetical protein
MLMAATGCAGDPQSQVDRPDGPTWKGAVQRIVATKCEGCHQEGSVGGFSLGSYESVSSIATTVADAVEQRRMPPWSAADGCNEYQGDFSLSEEERDTILEWVQDGAPLGEGPEADVQSLSVVEDLPRVDLTLSAPEPYVPTATPDDYRCFPIEWPLDEQKYVTGIQVIPDEESIVHHVIAYLLPGEYSDALEQLEAEDGRPGYSCFGGPGPIAQRDSEWLGGWAPGGVDRAFPEGTGIAVDPDTIVVLQIHYNLINDNHLADQTRIDVMVEDEVALDAWLQPFANPFWLVGDQMEIPAGSTDHEESFSYTFKTGGTIYSANLHMHLLGKHARFSIQRADGSETCLLEVPAYDFDWQRSYRFTEPQVLGPGDSLKLSCFFDNPTDQDVHWGDGTTDEMCLTTMYMID